MEEAGLIEVRPNENDARSKRVWITEKGRAFRNDAVRAVEPDVATLKLEFAEARVKAILPELTELRKIMDDLRDRD